MILSEQRILVLEKLAEHDVTFKPAGNPRESFPFKMVMFSIPTQWIYGDSVKDLIDSYINGTWVDRGYYGKEWLKRTSGGNK